MTFFDLLKKKLTGVKMKKKSKLIVSAMMLSQIVLSNQQAFSQENEASFNYSAMQENKSDKLLNPDEAGQMNQVKSILTDSFFISQANELKNKVMSKWSTISNKINNQISREFDRYRMQLTIGLKDDEFSLGKLDLGVDTYYQLVVEPSFRNGKQMRQDIIVVGLKGSNTISAGTQVRITFFREFDSKSEAIFSNDPYWISKIPRSAQDLDKLKDQDGVRLEVLGNLNIGHSANEIKGNNTVSSGISYGVDVLFMMDLFKHDKSTSRVRFVGTINRGSIRASANLIAGSNKIGWLPGKLKDVVEIGIGISGQKTLKWKDEFPIESQMVDYVFKFNNDKLSSENATTAFDEIIGNMYKAGFSKLYNPLIKESELTEALLSNARIAEKISTEDKNKPHDAQRVFHVFKGRMSTGLNSIKAGIKLSGLVKAESETGQSQSFVTSIEKDSSKKYYILRNTFIRNNSSYWFGRSQSEVINDLDILIQSDQNKSIGPMQDLVSRLQIRDSVIDAADFSNFAKKVDIIIPGHVQGKDEILKAIPRTRQKNSLMTFQYSMSVDALRAIEKYNVDELFRKLEFFVDNHPEKHKMGLPGSNAESSISEHSYLLQLAYDLNKLANSQLSNEERFSTLNTLLNNQLFTKYLISEFMTTLLRTDELDRFLGLNFYVSSDEISNKKVSLGQNKVSDVYSSVMTLRSIINERSLDLRIDTVTNPDGTTSIQSLNILKFKPK